MIWNSHGRANWNWYESIDLVMITWLKLYENLLNKMHNINKWFWNHINFNILIMIETEIFYKTNSFVQEGIKYSNT